jgi:hypothetical protein
MTAIYRVWCVLALLAVFGAAAPFQFASAEEAQFSLSIGQSVSVGRYVVVFRGVVDTLPSYDLYVGSTLVARFPNPFLPPKAGDYSYADVRVQTTGIASDGRAVTGIVSTQQIMGRLWHRFDAERLSARTSEVKP